jgi:CDP-glucose 4,6-dehydratase
MLFRIDQNIATKDDLQQVFRGRRVLVTGHTGFKGSWLSIWLHHLGSSVVGYSLPPHTSPNNFAASGVRDLLASHYEHDIRDADCLRRTLCEEQPEVVFHLAAQPLVRESYRSPRETFDTNVMGTVNLLEAVRAYGKPCVVVIVTSDKCYENREQVWGYRERDAMGGHDPYSASKGAAEIVVSAYRRSFFAVSDLDRHGVRVASARAGNVIGGGDWSNDRIITDIVRSLRQGQPIAVRSPHAVRPWQHVLEPLHGYLTLAARLLGPDASLYCHGWNLGPLPGEAIPVCELVEMFIDVWGSGTWEDASDPNRPHEAQLLRLSIDKAVSELSWLPRWNVREAVLRTATWFRQFETMPESMRERCLADIRDYETAQTDHRSLGSCGGATPHVVARGSGKSNAPFVNAIT